MTEEIRYQKCFIAYLDILGFEEKVMYSESNQEEIKLLLDALKICNAFASGNKKVTNDMGENRTISIQSRFFSDSIVFFLEDNSKDIGHLFLIIRYVQDRLWEKGLLIRGAISHGYMYLPKEVKERNITLGPEIIKAHRLESRIAIYPRIMVSKELYSFIEKKNIQAYPFAYKGQLSDYIRQDNDGVYFLDLLNENIIRAEGEKLVENGDMFSIVWMSNARSKHDEIMSCVKRCINICVDRGDEKKQQKYKWLKSYRESILC